MQTTLVTIEPAAHINVLLPAGTPAPDFALNASPERVLRLAELSGRPVVLAFYPGDWGPTCGDQMTFYNEVLPELRDHGAELIGISVDSAYSHAAYAQSRNLHFQLLSDFEPKGAVARLYGVYREQDGYCDRALFVIDAAGIIRWSHRSPVNVNPGADGILEALESIAVPVTRGAEGISDDR
jgi:peroxiredoxin